MFAAFYGGMRQASVKIIESMPQLGGQLAALYPEKYIYDVAGFPKVTAQELVNQLKAQMEHFEQEICLEEKVFNVVKKAERHFEIHTNKTVHHAKAVVISGGVALSNLVVWNLMVLTSMRAGTFTISSMTCTNLKARTCSSAEAETLRLTGH